MNQILPISILHIRKKCKNCKRTRLHKDKNAIKRNLCYHYDQLTLSGNEIIVNWLIQPRKEIVLQRLSGFSKIFKAKCDNCISSWNTHRQDFEFERNSDVVLKSLNDSKNINFDFLNEYTHSARYYNQLQLVLDIEIKVFTLENGTVFDVLINKSMKIWDQSYH
ncbi:25301_t:CDS:2 [Gigaspora margarita]|uniref:25301_t:CDS:1 n=1 Tax=Gigaspora margarita TaxID=4874 RepID=A0ABN7UIY2_GIGMA|nr:25301_t:CDS:2 [Gigaspora margarita]